MTDFNNNDSLSFGFIIYLITQVMTFLSLGYILIYYTINDIFKSTRLHDSTVISILRGYIFPQGYWLIFLPSFLLMAIIFVYLFIPLHNENIISKNSNIQYKKSLLYIDDKGKLYTYENLDIEQPGVEDLMLFKVNQRLYREKNKIFSDDPDWIVEDIYILF